MRSFQPPLAVNAQPLNRFVPFYGVLYCMRLLNTFIACSVKIGFLTNLLTLYSDVDSVQSHRLAMKRTDPTNESEEN